MITLPDLPYNKDALEPYISRKTLDFHHGKHHSTYVSKLNDLIKSNDFSEMDLQSIVIDSYEKYGCCPIFNNAAQVWNHTFYWNCLKKPGVGNSLEDSELVQRIKEDFGGVDKFQEQFADAAVAQFGSGWAWLVLDELRGNLEILKTSNAENPLIYKEKRALFTVDVWEHAYYLDYQNRRLEYVSMIMKYLVNWDFIISNYRNSMN